MAGNVTDYPIIFDAIAMRSLLAGDKTQARVPATSPLRKCRPGDRLWVKETCAGGRKPVGQSREFFSPMHAAEFVVFLDGWRQHRSGSGHTGPVLTGRQPQWTPAIHMPRWASRVTLVIESVRMERLRSIDRHGILAEGQIAAFAGLFWPRGRPARGIWRDPRSAFAATWNATHGTSGDRWEDDPEIIALSFRVERQ